MRLVIIVSLMVMHSSALATPRIINGERAKSNDWPWVAALVYAHTLAIKGQFCGGSLIAPQWVLTAGHCVEGETANSIEVVLGQHDLKAEKQGERIGVKNIIRHPDYDGNDFTIPPSADLALLQLQQPSTQPVLRIGDQYQQELVAAGTPAIVMGWGTTTRYHFDSSYPDNLQQALVPLVSHAVCNEPSSYAGDIQEDMLCAGFIDGNRDACVGDSGGPLIVESKSGWQQVGIVSYGNGCAQPNFYGVYTRLAVFQSFINKQICTPAAQPEAPELQVQLNDDHHVHLLWHSVVAAEGYQLYYAPYSWPVTESTLEHIHSLDLNLETEFTVQLARGQAFYVALRSYVGNCHSEYSNIGVVIIP